MKKTAILFLSICTTAVFYVSCSGGDDTVTDNTDVTSIGAAATIDAANEMDVNTALSVISTNSPTAKQFETSPGICAAVTVAGTTYPKVYTVDYGTGCTDNQITRKGKLKITLSGPITTTGSKLTIERIDYSVNALKLEGTIEYTNNTTVAAIPQWIRKVTNGKITDGVGNFYTNSGTHTVKQTAGVDTPFVVTDNVYEMTEGTHTITSDKGESLTLTVQETLVKKYSCVYISKGKLKVQGSVLNGVIDYGNNTCDNNYTYTHENGFIFNLAI